MTLEEHGDRANGAHAGYLAIRRLVLIGQLDEAERTLAKLDPAPLPPALRSVHELVVAGIAMRRLQTKTGGVLASIVVVLWEPPLLQSQSEAMPGNRAIPTAAASIRCSAWWRRRTRVRRTDRRAATAPHAPNQFSALTPVGRLKPC